MDARLRLDTMEGDTMGKNGYWTQAEVDELNKLKKFNIHLSLAIPGKRKTSYGHRGVFTWNLHSGDMTYVKWSFQRVYRGFSFTHHRISFLIGWR